MTEKQVCEMCDNYQTDKACEIKDNGNNDREFICERRNNGRHKNSK